MAIEINDTNFVSLLKTLIRYFASGFIFIIVFKYLEKDDDIWHFTTQSINWTLIVVAAICGLLIYSIHSAFLDDIFYRFSLFILKRKKNSEYFWPKQYDEKEIGEIMFSVTTNRYKRSMINDTLFYIQDRLDNLLAMLILLYTSSYSLIILPIIFSIKNYYNTIDYKFDYNYAIMIGLGIILLIFGILLDLKITKRELFMIKENEPCQDLQTTPD